MSHSLFNLFFTAELFSCSSSFDVTSDTVMNNLACRSSHPCVGQIYLFHPGLLSLVLCMLWTHWPLTGFCIFYSFPLRLRGKKSICNAGDIGSIPVSAKSPGEGNDNLLQYSCLENSHGQRSLAGYRPWRHKRVRHDLATTQQQCCCEDSCDLWILWKVLGSLRAPQSPSEDWEMHHLACLSQPCPLPTFS